MRKSQKFFSVILVFAVCIGIFTGCNPFRRNNVVETEYFRVRLNRDGGYAIVMELTELGTEQEILAIPSHVEGLPVRQIGYEERQPIGGSGRRLYINSDNLRKIYIPYTVTRILFPIVDPYGYGTGYGRCESFETVFLMTNYSRGMGGGGLWGDDFAGINITTQEFRDALLFVSAELRLPNIIYFYNFENAPNSNIFWLDHITGANLYLRPPAPIRVGYEFTGWYLETEGITLWDGVMSTSNDMELKLYAGWQIK